MFTPCFVTAMSLCILFVDNTSTVGVVVLFVVVAIMVVVVVVVLRRRHSSSSRFYTTLLLSITRPIIRVVYYV